MNRLIVLGCLISGLITGCLWRDPELGALALVVGTLTLGQMMGVTLIATGHRRAGAVIVLASSVALIPAGLIGALGARRLLDAVNLEVFEARRDGT